MSSVTQSLPTLTFQEAARLTSDALQECLRNGITTVHNAATNEFEFAIFKHLADNDALTVRVYMLATVKDLNGSTLAKDGPQIFGPFLQLRCLKLWMDGALGSCGAALCEPYTHDPSNRGLLLWEKIDLLYILRQPKAQGFQVAIHAIGDLANQFVLDAYESIGVDGLRWRIEHAQLLTPADINRFAQLNVIAGMQPLHAPMDMPWLESRIGPVRAKSGAFVWRSLLDSGAVIVGGSDSPVASMNPLWGMHAAITRQNHQRLPENGWYPDQRITSEEALKMYTIGAAYACFREHELGSLTAGKLADIVVLPENILRYSPEALLEMKVLYTIVNGKIRYQL